MKISVTLAYLIKVLFRFTADCVRDRLRLTPVRVDELDDGFAVLPSPPGII